MTVRAFAAVYAASAREFLRDKITVIVNLLFPALLAVFFGLLFSGSGGGPARLSVGAVLPQGGVVGEAFRSALSEAEAAGAVAVTYGVNPEEAARLVARGKLDLALVIGEEADARRLPIAVTAVYDPARQMFSGAAASFVRGLVSGVERVLQGSQPMFVVEERAAVPKRRLRMADFYVPSVLALSFLYLGLFGTALPLVDLRERKVLRRLGLTPLPRAVLLASQVAWRVTVAVGQAVVFVLIGVALFRVPVGHDWPGLAAFVLLGALTFVAMGYFMAAVSRSQESAAALLQLVNLPMTMLSGTMFPADALPPLFRNVVKVMPLTYLGDGIRQTMVGFAPLFPLWTDFAVLAGWLAVFAVGGALLFRWE